MNPAARVLPNNKMKIAIVVVLLMAAVSFAQNQPAQDHRTEDHPTQDQASKDQAAPDHPAEDPTPKDQPPKDQPTATRPRASCGSASVQFEIKTEKKRPLAQPAPDKALVYVVENLRAGCFLCDTTTKIGLDGTWMGATKGNSYLSFSLDPGEHHLCAKLQSESSSSETTSLASFIADAGGTYYFRVRLTDQNNSGKGGVQWALDLDPLDRDQGQFMIESYEASSYRKKK